MTHSFPLALLLSCAPDLKTGQTWSHEAPEVQPWERYEGTFTWLVQGAGAEEPGCEIVFQFESEPWEQSCETCEFAFELKMTYDADASTNTWRCVDPDTADFSWVLGYDADFYGYDINAIWMYHDYGAYWTQAFYAQREGDTVSFGYDFNSYYAYYYDYYFYSYQGTGTVTE